MSNELVRQNLETSLAASSLGDLVKAATDQAMLLIDVSGSMHGQPIDDLRKVVRTIQGDTPTPMIAFGGDSREQVKFVYDVPEAGGGTPLTQAIELAKQHGATRLVVISDGVPDNQETAMDAARAFGGRIDVVFVGDEGDFGSMFLDRLAQATGGTRFEGDLAEQKMLAGKVIGLLCGAVEEKAPIQGPGFSVVESADDDDDDADDDDDDADDDDEDDDEDDDK